MRDQAAPWAPSRNEALIFRRFGATPVSRWGAAEKLYESARMNARFALYPGEAHNVSAEMEKDVESFYTRQR